MVFELIQYMVDLDLSKFESLLDSYIITRGIEKTIIQIIFPFMEKIGILWQINHINPAQEHLVSNIIRQKLIVGIDNVNSSTSVNKTVLLFLPEGEYHELGLLFMHYLFKSRGVNTIYLGCDIPLEEVEYVVNLKSPDYLYCHLTALTLKFNFDKFISHLTQKLTGITIVLSGQLTHGFEKKIHPPIFFKKSFSDVMEFISGL